jgi:hypothetical protein
LCENMPSGTAARPGDVITAMNGKTVEVRPPASRRCEIGKLAHLAFLVLHSCLLMHNISSSPLPDRQHGRRGSIDPCGCTASHARRVSAADSCGRGDPHGCDRCGAWIQLLGCLHKLERPLVSSRWCWAHDELPFLADAVPPRLPPRGA